MRRSVGYLLTDPAVLLRPIEACGGWSLDTYRACEFRCVYCITSMQGVSEPRLDAAGVRERLPVELRGIDSTTPVGVGSFCDAYPTVEADAKVTRAAVEVLVASERSFRIITKGTTVRRDVDLLGGCAFGGVNVSLCSIDEEQLTHVDPAAPPAQERLATIRMLAGEGVDVVVSAAPWIPGVTDAEALFDAVPTGIEIRVAPLNVTSTSRKGAPFRRRFDQRAINDAYLAAFARSPDRPNVRWLPPIDLDLGRACHPFGVLTKPRPAPVAAPD
jgi:DNA repair photolyase